MADQWQSASASPPEGAAASGDQGHIDRVKQEGREKASQARRQMMEFAGRHKNRLGEGLESVGNALHRTADSLRHDNGSRMAEYADRAADKIGQWSHDVRDRDTPELVRRIGDYARRQPGLVLGAAVGAGVVIGRFLKSRPPERREPPGPDVQLPGTTAPPPLMGETRRDNDIIPGTDPTD